jgi:hypothetical protein
MPIARARFVQILAGVCVILVILELVRRRRLREEYALSWLLAGAVVVALGVAPEVLWYVSPLLGVEYPPILLVTAGLFLIGLVLLSQVVTISEMARKNRDLAQQVAIMDLEMGQMREALARVDGFAGKPLRSSEDGPVPGGDPWSMSGSIENLQR